MIEYKVFEISFVLFSKHTVVDKVEPMLNQSKAKVNGRRVGIRAIIFVD
jgi:hypothetical protein